MQSMVNDKKKDKSMANHAIYCKKWQNQRIKQRKRNISSLKDFLCEECGLRGIGIEWTNRLERKDKRNNKPRIIQR